MRSGDTIIIRAINNGVMIEPAAKDGTCFGTCHLPYEEVISFQNADDFLDWIKKHFSIYKIPSYDDTEKKNE